MMKILQSDSTDISTLLVLFYVKVCILELLIRNTVYCKKTPCENLVHLFEVCQDRFLYFAVPISNLRSVGSYWVVNLCGGDMFDDYQKK